MQRTTEWRIKGEINISCRTTDWGLPRYELSREVSKRYIDIEARRSIKDKAIPVCSHGRGHSRYASLVQGREIWPDDGTKRCETSMNYCRFYIWAANAYLVLGWCQYRFRRRNHIADRLPPCRGRTRRPRRDGLPRSSSASIHGLPHQLQEVDFLSSVSGDEIQSPEGKNAWPRDRPVVLLGSEY